LATMTNKKILAAMTTFAGERLKGGAHQLVGGRNVYVRVSGKGFRAVSVDEASPLSGLKGARTTKKLDKAKEGAAKGSPEPFGTDLSKDERSLQAQIIRKALEAGGDLRQALGGKKLPFTELIFAFDEVRLNREHGKSRSKTIRCDLLAVGKAGRGYEPVLIELKFELNRKQAEVLKQQLADFVSHIHAYHDQFAVLLKAATGLDVDTQRVHTAIAWSKKAASKVPSDLVSDFDSEGICAVAFDMNPKLPGKMRTFGKPEVVAGVSRPTERRPT
jgi:hypothetical protein